MNKILFAILIAGLFVLPVVFALETNQTQLTAEEQATVGYTPDHPFYGLERAMERLRVVFAGDERAKAELHVQLAYERLVEAKAMEQKNKTQFVPKLVKDYEDEINAANTSMADAEKKGYNMTLVKEHVLEMTSKHLAILQRVMENAPEVAKSGLQNAIQHAEQLQERMRQRVNESIQGENQTPPKTCTADSDCDLNECDCQCYVKGAEGGPVCGAQGKDCVAESNVSGCKCTSGGCEIMMVQAQQQNQTVKCTNPDGDEGDSYQLDSCTICKCMNDSKWACTTLACTENNTTTATGNIVNVEMKNIAFKPSTITINVGDTVVWTNEDHARHRVADSISSAFMIRNNFGSKDLNYGDKYNYTFTQAGTFKYQCIIHPTMTGVVIVT